MKKIATLFTILFAMILVLDSCSVQKRYHRKGFTVNWNNASVKMNKNRKVVHSESIQKDIVVSNSKKTEKLTKTYQAPAKNYIVHNDTSHPSAIDLSLNNSEAKIRDKISNKESLTRELSKIEVKSTIKDAKAIIKAIKKEQKKQGANTDIVLLVLLAILLPPLAVYLYEGYWTDRCTINLILTLLCGLGIIHALVVILGNR